MKRLPPLPRGSELALFAAVAIGCGALTALFRSSELAMLIFSLPIFVVAAWMGMRRSGQWAGMSASPESSLDTATIDEEELAV